MYYLVESSLALLVFYGFYHFFLAGENSYRFNRFYLLGSVILALLLPFVQLDWYVLPADPSVMAPEIGVIPTILKQVPAVEPAISYVGPNILMLVYFVGVSVSMLRFFANLLSLLRSISVGDKINKRDYQLVLLPGLSAPFSFLHYCFLNEEKYRTQKIDERILQHELAHIRQRHTIDVLIIECMLIFFWFQPILYWYKKAIRLNHEYLSDEAALEYCKDVISYQILLLNYLRAQRVIPLASPSHFSLTKKRFQMIKYHNTKPKNHWKKILVFPIFLLTFFFFCITLKGQAYSIAAGPTAMTSKTFEFQDTIPPNLPPPHIRDKYLKDPPKPEFKLTRPSQKEIQDWLDAKTYGLWVDRKRVNNNWLKGKKTADFGWYMVSRLMKNAVNYGKHTYQVDLYTREYFDKYMPKKE